uniref:Uncharacterized protein n=1 Tax=Oryza brachyantha TaxID=4533 RepID=J3MIQ0_ORYBR
RLFSIIQHARTYIVNSSSVRACIVNNSSVQIQIRTLVQYIVELITHTFFFGSTYI